MTAKDNDFPLTIYELQKELHDHAQDGRNDDIFRGLIALDQFGSFVRHITHDQNLNPASRPHGTRDLEISDAGHFLIQAMTLVDLRGIDIQEALKVALLNLREKDFMKRESVSASKGFCRGLVASTPLSPSSSHAKDRIMAYGEVYLDIDGSRLNEAPFGSILVTNHPEANLSRYVSFFGGIVTDNGGTMCHAAIVCREAGKIPCVVGTGSATKTFCNGDYIRMYENGLITKV